MNFPSICAILLVMTLKSFLASSICAVLLLLAAAPLALATSPSPAPAARQLPISTFELGGVGTAGGGTVGDETVESMFESLVTVLFVSIVPLSLAMFTIGAFLYIISAEAEERKNQGKEFMKYALIGLAVVVGAKGIVNMTLFFIYGS